MAAISTIALVAGAVFAGVGAYQAQQARGEAREQLGIQSREQRLQGAEQRKQFEAQQRIADIRNARERAEFVRRGTVARAIVLNQGALGGTSQSSGVAGGAAGVQTQVAAGLGTFEAMSANQTNIVESQSRQAESVVRSGVAGAALTKATVDVAAGQALQSLGSSLFDAGGGYKTIFDKAK